ncbi:UDP-glucose 6-dehydrogenase, partial [Micrococcus terreus]|uniref:UDP binding domain-containing protein n=1 Tax=Micrococcus terreus TaxID=574650 RepID=UPI002882E5BA
LDRTMAFLNDIDDINLRRRDRVVDLAVQVLNCGAIEAPSTVLPGKKIAILGVTFKPDSDDVRDSPALDVANRLFTAGAEVAVYDPQGNRNAAGRFPRLDYVDSLQQAVTGADLAILLTEWDEFKQMDPAQLAPLMKHPAIIDGRNVLDPQAWIDAGFTHAALGHRFDPTT